MTVVVPHHSTQNGAIAALDKAADKLLSGQGTGSVQIVNPQKAWDGPVMTFGCTGKLGFISVPLAGAVTVDETNVTVHCDLPPMVTNFVGEQKVRGMVSMKIAEVVQPS